jgi:arabinose-5-phosphate isomerase
MPELELQNLEYINTGVCDLGQAVIKNTIQALHTLNQRIDHHFAKACHYLLNSKGHVVVMGIGKSGHIARKIAATLASTGSPAFFVHPAEARHGDIGMITADDVIIVISKSGETEEIVSLLPFIKRLDIPLITITGNSTSTLAKMATVNLDASVEKEACPLGLAPTTSTTVALVMGDALAIALLEKRGFTEKDFALSHPGGSLGKRLLRVEEVMHKGEQIPLVLQNTSLKNALVEMTQKKLGMTTVVNENGKLVGIFTDGDVRRAFDKNADIHQTAIHEVMTKNPKVISTSLLAAEALHIMETYKITALIVADEESKPVGIVHMHDILKAGVV